MQNATAFLARGADKQENDGPYRADWATLMKYETPQWYKDAKFGIFIHWGVYSVPAAENEWYPRNMYRPSEGAYKNFHGITLHRRNQQRRMPSGL